STIIPIADPAVDHRMYLSLAGVVAIVVVGGYVLARAVTKRTIRIERMQKFLTALGPTAAVCAIVVILGILSHRRNQQYGEAITMWADVVAKRPHNARAHYNLGRCFSDAGRNEEAIGSYNAAIRLESNYATAHCSLGNALVKTGRLNEAMGHYRIAIQYREMFEDRLELAIAYTNLAKALAQLNRLAEAVSCYRTAIDLKSDFAQAQYDLASTLCTIGRYSEAVGHFELTIKNAHKLNSPVELARAHNNLANALAKLGKEEEAIGHYRRAVEVNPDHVSAYINLGRILTRLGRHQEAIPNYRQAAGLQPDNADVLYALGITLEKLGKTAQAVEAYDRALRANPNLPHAMNKLAWILATCPDPTVRDGNRALALIEKLCTATRFRYAPHLDALAAAYAETGQFERAVATARLAIKLTGANETPELTHQRQGRVKLYQQNKPLRIEQ
ncbi:MAG: tetratricopeptide repeat protein, partial [Phycisphaerae bacterium]|nr:tetratricopeptide repeat protein [Phycisphaerae bacterium]